MVMSIEEVCELLGCSRAKVFELLRAGSIERAPKIGRRLRIYRDSVEALLARPTDSKRPRQKRASTPPPPVRREDLRW